MEELKSLASVLLCVLCLCSAVVNGSDYVKYNTGARVVAGKLNVHLVAHSHDDVGWLKTVDQYYVGSNNSIQVLTVYVVVDQFDFCYLVNFLCFISAVIVFGVECLCGECVGLSCGSSASGSK